MDVQALVGTTGAGTAAGAAAPESSTATPPVPHDTSDASLVLGEAQKKPVGIAPAIAKIFGGGDAHPSEPAVTVSYKVEGKTIHTVFTDPTTGQEIAQFPPDLLQHIAAFFDASQGVTLDKQA